MPQRKTKRAAGAKRKRANAVQIYLSTVEQRQLRDLIARRDCNTSDLIRGWIARAVQAHEAADRARARESAPAPADPRQLQIPGAP